MSLADQYIKAMRAEAIPEAEQGLWRIKRTTFDKFDALSNSMHRTLSAKDHNPQAGGRTVTPGTYTFLLRHHMGTMHRKYGECVMDDTFPELATHLNFAMKASGKVIVTGLGLGCIARGLTINKKVQSITVIERDKDIIELVAKHMPQDNRIKIVQADAFDWIKQTRASFDFAWHDIWSDPDKDEQHLSTLHAKLINDYFEKTQYQGVWGMQRRHLHALKRHRYWYENAKAA